MHILPANLEILITVWFVRGCCQQIFECIETAAAKPLGVHSSQSNFYSTKYQQTLHSQENGLLWNTAANM